MQDELVERCKAAIVKGEAEWNDLPPRRRMRETLIEGIIRAIIPIVQADQRERDAGLRAHVEALIQLAVDGGLTHDIVAQLYPDAKKPNGQPLCEFSKRARRVVNEAKAAIRNQEQTDG